MKRLPAALIILTCLAVAHAAEEPTVATLIGDRAPTAILRLAPEKVPPEQRPAAISFAGGHQVIGDPVPLDAAQAARLAALVRSPDSFGSAQPVAKMRAIVAYRFGAGSNAIDMLVCFFCDKAAFVPAGQEAAAATSHISQSEREVLIGLAKEVLPQDEVIQELPKLRNGPPEPPHAVPARQAPVDLGVFRQHAGLALVTLPPTGKLISAGS